MLRPSKVFSRVDNLRVLSRSLYVNPLKHFVALWLLFGKWISVFKKDADGRTGPEASYHQLNITISGFLKNMTDNGCTALIKSFFSSI